MRDEHLDTISATKSDEVIKSSVENLIPIPSESEGGIDDDILLTIKDDILRENLLNVNHLFAKIEASNDNLIPFYDPIIYETPLNLTPSGESDFFLEVDAFLAVEDEPTSSQFPKSYLDSEGDMLLLEAFLNDDHSFDFKTNDDQSCFDEDVLEKIVSKPLSKEEITAMKSLRTHDSSLPILSKIDSLLDELAGELTLLKSIPLRIDETDCDFEEDIRLIEKLLYDNSTPQQSSLGCSSVPFLSPLIHSIMGKFGQAHLTLNKRFVGVAQYSRIYEDSRQIDFVLQSSFSPLFNLGITYPNLID
nr:hypothetical protein [Tanacetum cinerariifolium]